MRLALARTLFARFVVQLFVIYQKSFCLIIAFVYLLQTRPVAS